MTTLKKIGANSSFSKDKFYLVPESLSLIIGYEESIVLTRIQYWINVCGKHLPDHDGLWVYNSQISWKKQFPFFSLYKIKKIIYFLQDSGILISKKVNAKKWNHTKWYTINCDKLSSLFKVSKSNDRKILSKSTNQLAENQPINNITKNNYTNNSSYIERSQVNKHQYVEEKIKNNFNKNCFKASSKNQQLMEHSSNTEVAVTKEEQEKAKEMLSIWNEEFKYSLKPIKAFSNKKIAKRLYNLHQTQFNSNLEEWRNYALKVNSSKFLMGEKESKTGFKAVFQWLTKAEIVEAIQGGAYGVGDRELDRNNLMQNIEKQKEEIIKQTGGKIAQYLKNNVSEEKEKAEFNTYVLGKKFEKDGDIYRIKHLVTNNTWLSPQGLIHDSRHKGMYQTLYESYVMKKYLGKTNLEAREEIKRNIDSLSQKSRGVELFEKLNFIKNKIEAAIFNACENSNMLSIIEQNSLS